jgi:uracil-DNA glycosylase family 4
MKPLSSLELIVESGVTDFVGNAPRNFLCEANTMKPEAKATEAKQAAAAAKPVKVVAAASMPALTTTIEEARKLADNAKNLAELRASVEGFEGCGLKKMANKTVFADGNPETRVMLIGEAPGADEDEQGIPFCGMSGQLLDKVLKSIGLDRKTGFYITNTIFWRPPGNRKPTPEELAICEPFLEKHIALVNPKILLLVGATAVTGVLKNNESMGKLRSKLFNYKNRYLQNDVPVMVTYHPSFLMRAPINKRLAWEDMLEFKAHIERLK